MIKILSEEIWARIAAGEVEIAALRDFEEAAKAMIIELNEKEDKTWSIATLTNLRLCVGYLSEIYGKPMPSEMPYTRCLISALDNVI